jgi:hypothetical protein
VGKDFVKKIVGVKIMIFIDLRSSDIPQEHLQIINLSAKLSQRVF